jgi:Na+/proline symporter
MLQGWVVIAVALGYIGLLFLVASYGDRIRRLGRDSRARLLIYPLSLAIYCTSWTFFGSVGSASRSGYEFLTIYIGPVLMIGLFAPVIVRVVRLAKAQNITSIADFIAARYGKSQAVAATVALIAIIGTVPYIALQLKAVSFSLETIIAHSMPMAEVGRPLLGDMALYVALSMAVFAVLFGTRHIDATEHQDGLMLAVAAESIVKLLSFLAVGIFVTFWMFDGPIALFSKAMNSPLAASVLTREPPLDTLLAMTLLSFFAILLLPRQFHVAVVENNDEREIKRARWMFPIYLVLINLFVVPIAIAGLMTFPGGQVDGDMFVLALPLQAGSSVLTIAAFVGGLSAATAMVIVETVALAIMVSNDIVVPWVLQRREALITGREDVGSLLLTVRRLAIFVILLFAYMYYRFAGDSQLAAIGILAFAAIAQLAPAFFIGLIWRNATARGAIGGMTVGILTWAYTLLLPTFVDNTFLAAGPWGVDWLRPQHLFGMELPPLVHGVMWSFLLNILATIGFSTGRAPSAIERMQGRPVRADAAGADDAELPAVALVGDRRGADLDGRPLSRRGAHPLLVRKLCCCAAHQPPTRRGGGLSAPALRRAPARLPRSGRPRRGSCCRCCCASDGLHQGRAQAARRRQRGDPLQPRNPADRARPRAPGHRGLRQGPALICWNRQFGEILDLPPELTAASAPASKRSCAIPPSKARSAPARSTRWCERLRIMCRTASPI